MAEQQRKIKPALKRQLIDKAGGKCANPGCSNWRVHIHHIKHWAIYESHTAEDMIAICPSCHDSAHHGRLRISDALLYEWKTINRLATPDNAHIFVEPSKSLKLLAGTIAISTSNDQAAVFELSNSNHLKFRILDHDILQLSARLLDGQGTEIFRVVENHVRVAKNDRIIFDYHPGRARVTLPVGDGFIPDWMMEQVRRQDPLFAADGRVVALNVQVLKPGLIRVQGCWPDGNVGVAITERALSFCALGQREPTSLVGGGEDTVLLYAGPVTKALFGFK